MAHAIHSPPVFRSTNDDRPGLPILVVEDDADIRDLVAAVLEREGYEVVQACNGQEALDFLRAGNLPALILLDLMMPVLSGPELLEILAEDTALAELPVVVVSALACGKGGGVGSAPGVREFLQKPVSADTLREIAATYCQPGSSHASGEGEQGAL